MGRRTSFFFHFIYSYLDTIPYQHNKVNININNIKKKIKLLFQGVVFVEVRVNLTVNSFDILIIFKMVTFVLIEPVMSSHVSIANHESDRFLLAIIP